MSTSSSRVAAANAETSVLKRVGRGITWARNFTLNTVFILFAVFFLVALISSCESYSVPEGSALLINPAGVVVEEPAVVNPLAELIAPEQGFAEIRLSDLTTSIERAAADERISALVLELDDLLGISLTGADALAQAVRDFKASGKPVSVYGSSFFQQQYRIASEADAVYLHPFGQFILQGYGGKLLYYKDLLDKYDVTAHVFRAGDFKDAVEPYLRSDMSAESREANQAMLDVLWQRFVTRVAENRKLAPEQIANFADSLADKVAAAGGDSARAALEAELVDELLTPDQANARMADQVGADAQGVYSRVDYRAYLTALGVVADNPLQQGNVAYIVVDGTIMMSGGTGVAAADTITRQIRSARLDDDIKAILLRVDSPGGSAFASELIRQELELVQISGKPVVASMGSVAASGGYWVAATADEVFAEPGTITGSIGVFSLFPTFEKALAKFGVHSDGVGTTALSGGLSPISGITQADSTLLQTNVDFIYQQFLNLVARGREMELESVRAVAGGRVWVAEQALAHGLVDQLGGTEAALAAIAARAGLETPTLKRFTAPPTLRDLLAGGIVEAAERASASPELSRVDGWLRSLRQEISRWDDPRHVYAVCRICEPFTATTP